MNAKTEPRQIRCDDFVWPTGVEVGPVVTGPTKGIGLKFEGMDFVFGITTEGANLLVADILAAIQIGNSESN